MKRRLRTEIKQQKPFDSPEQEVFLNIQRTADVLMRELEETLKPAGLSHTQYNVLRILRGAGPEGLACREAAERMLTHDPDMTRLLDRLEARGLIVRSRERKDRRVITTRITEGGVRLLKDLDEPVAKLHQRQLAHMGGQKLRRLVELMEVVRAKRQ